jgi:hypothetical protein
MITKAGIAANKVYVGMSSYGRSFRMSQTDCEVLYALFALEATLDAAVTAYSDVNNNYDSKFAAYRRYMKEAVPYQLQRWADWYGHYDGAADGADESLWRTGALPSRHPPSSLEPLITYYLEL